MFGETPLRRNIFREGKWSSPLCRARRKRRCVLSQSWPARMIGGTDLEGRSREVERLILNDIIINMIVDEDRYIRNFT